MTAKQPPGSPFAAAPSAFRDRHRNHSIWARGQKSVAKRGTGWVILKRRSAKAQRKRRRRNRGGSRAPSAMAPNAPSATFRRRVFNHGLHGLHGLHGFPIGGASENPCNPCNPWLNPSGKAVKAPGIVINGPKAPGLLVGPYEGTSITRSPTPGVPIRSVSAWPRGPPELVTIPLSCGINQQRVRTAPG